VFVVASARADFDPAAVLFEFDGVRRDTAPSREAGQAIAPCVTNGPPFSRTGNERVKADAMVVAARMVAFGEYSIDGTASAMKARDYKDATDLVAQPMVVHGTQDPCVSDIAFAQGRNNGGENVLMQPMVFDTTNITSPANGSNPQPGDPCFTLAKGQHAPLLAQPTSAAFKYTMGAKAHGIGYAEEQSPTLDTKADSNAVLTPAMAVRRLTPVECERLQGFPDNYTNIPWRKKDESPDGPRYKALGNSWAVPNVRWIGKRIQEQINAA
jgi:DNA (cytosine-5)-methyltransferase 1